MFLIALRNLRARPARTSLTALAIALGVGMIFAMRIVGVTITESAREAREGRLAGADLEVVAANNANLNDALAGEIAARPEVAAAAPVYRRLEGRQSTIALDSNNPASLIPSFEGTGLLLLGVDPARSLTPYKLAAGEFFAPVGADRDPPRQVLLPANWAAQNGLGVGSNVALTTGSQTNDYTVLGLIKEEALGGQPTAWLPLPTMQAAFDTPGAATTLLVRLKPGHAPDAARDALQVDLGALFIVTSAQGGATNRPLFGILLDYALPFAGIAILLSGAFLVYNAFAITLTERRREIGQLRTLGMTRGQVLAQTLTEAAVVAVLGSLIGLVLGAGLGYAMTFVILYLQGLETRTVPLPLDGMLLAVGTGLIVTLAVTFNLARRAGRVSPLVALKIGEGEGGRDTPRPYEKWGWVGGVILLTGYLVWHPFLVDSIRQSTNVADVFVQGYLAPFVLAGVALLFLPGGVQLAVWAFEKIAARFGVAARLAAGSLARQRGRATLTTATLAIGLMLVVGLSGMTLSQSDMMVSNSSELIKGDFMLIRSFPAGASLEQVTNATAFPPIPRDLQADLESLSEEADVQYLSQVRMPGLSLGPGLDIAYGGEPAFFRDLPLYQPAAGSWEEAERYFAAGPALILPEVAARRLKVGPGDTVQVDTLKGKTPFTVAMVGGFLPVITLDVARDYFGAYPWMLSVEARAGQDKAALEARLEELAQKHRLLFTPDPKTLAASLFNSILNITLYLFGGLTSISGIVAGLALINTLIASVLERQREIGVLRAIGMSRVQVRALIVIEAGLLGLAGSLIGVLGGLMISVAYGQLSNAMGELMFSASITSLPPQPWGVVGAALLVGPAIAILAALFPADRAANVNPTEAMRAEGAAGFLKPAIHLGPTGLRGLVARMPLAAKLSLTTGLVLILTILALMALVIHQQRQLLEDNVRSIAARGVDATTALLRDQIGTDVTRLDPPTLARLQAQSGEAMSVLQSQLLTSGSRYEFGLKYFFITDPDLTVIFGDQPEYLHRVLTDTVAPSGPASVIRFAEWGGERVFEAIAPLENQAGQRVGLVVTGISTEPLDRIVRDTAWSAAWITSAALIVAALVTVLFTRRALAPVVQIAEASQAVAHGDLSQRVPQTRWDELGQLARAFNDMVTGLNEREHIRDLFGRYVSPEVQQEILAGRVTLRGERKAITCLYVDMRGSTAFAEAHAPEDVMEALNQYFEVVILAVEAHGGIVNRFVGDEVVCVFGAPTEYRDHAERALNAALSIREGLRYLNQKRTSLGSPTLKFGMGLNSGVVTAGATGSEERQEYTVIGDAMNVGARIQALNKQFPAHDILLSEFTRAGLKNHYPLVDLGPVKLRGKSEPVRVFAVT